MTIVGSFTREVLTDRPVARVPLAAHLAVPDAERRISSIDLDVPAPARLPKKTRAVTSVPV